jgi:hypothetical protein
MKKCIIFEFEQIHSIPMFKLETIKIPFIHKGFVVSYNLKNNALGILEKAINFKNDMKNHFLSGVLNYKK